MLTPRLVRAESFFLPFWSFAAEGEWVTPSSRVVAPLSVDGPAGQIYAGHWFSRRMTEVLKCERDAAVRLDARLLDIGDSVTPEPWGAFNAA